MILEGLVTTTDADGRPHLAPMGPTVDGPGFRTFLLRPFPTSNTYRNLAATRQGVLHVTDDVRLLARAALGKAAVPSVRPADAVAGFVLADCCRYYEFRVTRIDPRGERVKLDCEVVRASTVRDFFGFNRAKHAVLEAAILATRFHLLPAADVFAEFQRLKVAVEKTAGPDELSAWAFLEAEWAAYRERAGR